MPVVERDPWRVQYFEGIDCPEDLIIPTEDSDAYRLYPNQRWVYNKLAVAESQGLKCGLHGVGPERYPVFSKPVYNMRGMGSGTRVLRSEKDYERHNRPGHFWLPLLEGEHVSTDVAVVGGEPRWWRRVKGKALNEGTFDYWTILAEATPEDRGVLRVLAEVTPGRLHGHGESGDYRGAHHRGASALRRPVA